MREVRSDMRKRAFTILELLMVVGIIAVLAGILLPSLSKARDNSRTLACLAHLREFGAAWANYATENEEVLMPSRMYEKPGGAGEPNNWYEVGNGFHYRPRWPAVLIAANRSISSTTRSTKPGSRGSGTFSGRYNTACSFQ